MAAAPALGSPVFIVAQYKCGTSWLLSALSAHPQLVGIRELDLLRACLGDDPVPGTLPSIEHRRQHLFANSSWSHGNAYDEAMAQEKPRSVATGMPVGIEVLSAEQIARIDHAITHSVYPLQLAERFLDIMSEVATSDQQLVMKSANQIMSFDYLQRWMPDAPKIAITRDGRDAAISAVAYRKFVADKPWFGGAKSYKTLLMDWCTVARELQARHEAGQLYLMRYEDLTADFAGTLGRLLDWLGLDSSPGIVAGIAMASDFERLTGRPRGSDGTGVRRKGAVGEFSTELSKSKRNQSWAIAGEELAAFGYAKKGVTERPFAEVSTTDTTASQPRPIGR